MFARTALLTLSLALSGAALAPLAAHASDAPRTSDYRSSDYRTPDRHLAYDHPADRPADRHADAACTPGGVPGWDVAGRLARRETCLTGRARAYRDGIGQDARQRIQAGRDRIDAARTLPERQADRLRNEGAAEQDRLNALGRQGRTDAAGMMTGGL
ncbi:hypothetical protein AAC691_09620 [Nguyenibacter vanlangensis]|uniref:UrcA family protein n=1 Tax=Nguyenibacter vanlangensis TaxID=1216886 RepID=A0ABZ3DA00_9PROT